MRKGSLPHACIAPKTFYCCVKTSTETIKLKILLGSHARENDLLRARIVLLIQNNS